jgi:hypothetical protein
MALRETVAGPDGRYCFSQLHSGPYHLTAIASGRSPVERDGVEIRGGQSVRLDISMPPVAGDHKNFLYGNLLAFTELAVYPGTERRGMMVMEPNQAPRQHRSLSVILEVLGLVLVILGVGVTGLA